MSIEIETMQRWLAGEPVWPFARIIETWGEEYEHYMWRMYREIAQAQKDGIMEFRSGDTMRHTLARGLRAWRVRDEWVQEFGFAIPCKELLDELSRHELVVDVGAGSGYMTRLMLNHGVTAIATNPLRDDYSFEHGKYAQIAPLDGKTAARTWPDATIFCSWPTLNHTWFRQMLHAMRVGQQIVVIREGACAEQRAWQYLDDCFEETETITIPVFNLMNDRASVHVKRRQRARRGDGTAMQP